MSILKKITITFILCFFGIGHASDLNYLDSAYSKGNIDYLREILPKVKSDTQEDEKRIEYYKALTQSSPNFVQGLQNISTQEDNPYSQASYLELGKISYLNKKYSQAKTYLEKITNPPLLTEKSYWLAYCQYALTDYQTAIYQAQNFLQLSLDNDKIESSYILISDCYIKLGNHKLALELLLSIEQLKLFSSQRAAALYNIALCYQELKNEAKQKETTFLLKKDFPYSKYSKDLGRLTNNNQLTGNFGYEEDFSAGSYLQVGAFQDNENALEAEQTLKDKGYRVKIHKELSGQTLLYKVWVGPLNTAIEASTAKKNLLVHNFPSFVVQPTPQKETTTLSQKNYFLECGVFTDSDKLRERLQVLKNLGIEATAYRRQIGKNSFMYGVIGPFPDKEKALIQQEELKKHNLASNLFIK